MLRWRRRPRGAALAGAGRGRLPAPHAHGPAALQIRELHNIYIYIYIYIYEHVMFIYPLCLLIYKTTFCKLSCPMRTCCPLQISRAGAGKISWTFCFDVEMRQTSTIFRKRFGKCFRDGRAEGERMRAVSSHNFNSQISYRGFQIPYPDT